MSIASIFEEQSSKVSKHSNADSFSSMGARNIKILPFDVSPHDDSNKPLVIFLRHIDGVTS